MGTGRIVGSSKTSGLAARQLASYSTSFNYIKTQLGGFKLYYRSVMAELGLIYLGGPGFLHPLDVPSEKGKELAEGFRQAIRPTRYYREYFERDAADVPHDVVVEYIRRACLCQLQCADAPDRPALVDAFLHQPNHDIAAERRATFRFLLDLASQTTAYSVSEDDFRLLVYFGATEDGMAYSPSPAVMDTYRRWRLYQAREYYVFALNALWYCICEWGLEQGGDLHPIPLTTLWQHLDASLAMDRLAGRLRLPPAGLGCMSTMSEMLQWIRNVIGAEGDIPFDLACDIHARMNEDRLYRRALQGRRARPADASALVAGMIALLCLIYLRFGSLELRLTPEWSFATLGGEERLSLDGFLRGMRTRIHNGSATIGEISRWLVEDYVIRQHQYVAMGKLPEDTFRFQRGGDRLRFFRCENDLGFASAGFEALTTTLHELGLCDWFHEPSHALTADGLRLLDKGD